MKLNEREDKEIIESKLIDLVTGYVDEVTEIDVNLTPEQVIFIKELLKELEKFDITLIGNSAWNSIAVYFQFKTVDSVDEFEFFYKSGRLKKFLERMFRCLLQIHMSDSELIQNVVLDLKLLNSIRNTSSISPGK